MTSSKKPGPKLVPKMPKCLLCADPIVLGQAHANVSSGLICYGCMTRPEHRTKAADHLRLEAVVASTYASIENLQALQARMTRIGLRTGVLSLVAFILALYAVLR